MALMKNLSIAIISVFFVLSMLATLSKADNHATSNNVQPQTICQSTTYPSYCKTMFSNNNQNGSIFDYGRFSVRKSLSQSRKFFTLLDSYLQDKSSLSQPTIAALEDCKFLAELNLEYLSNTHEKVDKAGDNNNTLQDPEAEDLHTFLSAVLTNQETCLEGLQTTNSDQRVKNGISSSLSNDTKLHSVSLALFTKGWVPKKNIETTWGQNNNGRHLGFRNGRLPLKMSSRVREIYDNARRGGHGRKLLQTGEDDESVMVSDIIVVSQDGSGNFSNINDAIAAAPNNTAASDGYFVIFITEGVYQEYVSIAKNKKNLMIIGDGINRTIITGDHNVVDGSTTFNSATFAVVAQGFVAVNITFRNSAGPSKHQAVAVRNGADLSTFYSCSFEGYQDTLYIHSLRQFYRECDIYGTVDFIFGNAAAVFQSCNLYPRLPMSGQFNAITAQGRTDPNQNTGISIHDATIKATDDLAPMIGTIKTYLGRPWKEYSRTIYLQSFLDSLIDGAGWHEWSGDFALSTLYYAEFNNTGLGSNTENRVTWLGYHVIGTNDAANFTVSNFLDGDGWLPQTGVPYLSGLI